MADLDPVSQKFQLDVTDVAVGAEQLEKYYTQMTNAVVKHVTSMDVLNGAGELLKKYVKVTTEGGQEVNAVFTKLDDGTASKASQSITKAFKDIDVSIRANLQRLGGYTSAYKRLVNELDGDDASRLQKAFQRAFNPLATGQVESDKFGDIYKDLKADPTKTFFGDDQKVAEGVRAYINLVNKLKTAQSQSALEAHAEAVQAISDMQGVFEARQKDIAQTTAEKEAQDRLDQSLRQSASDAEKYYREGKGNAPSTATQQETTRYNASVSDLIRPIQNGQITLDRWIQIVNAARNQINVSLNDSVEKGVYKATTAADTYFEQQGDTAEKQSIRIRRALQQVSEQGKKSATDLIINFQSFVRLVEVQFVHTALRQLIYQFSESVEGAAKLQRAISEILTISQSTSLTLPGLIQGLKSISNETGIAISDVAEATYQSISNQVASGQAALDHVRELGQFALTSVSSLKDAVDLVDATLNAYDLSVTKTTQVSAEFFKTVQLGRLRVSDIANTFGNLAEPAAQLGVSLEEVQAALARLTIQGTKPAQAITLLQNVFTKLIKPTKDMQEVLHGLGYESGTSAIAGLGLVGVLQALTTAAGGSSDKIADFFNNVRGFRGVIGLTSDLKAYQQTIDKITNSSEEYLRAQGLIKSSDGFTFDKDLNEIKNFFTADVGSTTLKTVVDLSSELGGLTNVVKDLTGTVIYGGTALLVFYGTMKIVQSFSNPLNTTFYQIARSIIAAGKAALNLQFSQMGSKLKLAANITKEFVSSLLSVENVIGAVAAGLAIGVEAYEQYSIEVSRVADETRTKLQEQYTKDLEAWTAKEAAKLDATDRFYKATYALGVSFAARSNSILNQGLESFESKLKQVNDDVETISRNVLSGMEKNISGLNNQISEVNSAMNALTREGRNFQTNITDKEFGFNYDEQETQAGKVKTLLERYNSDIAQLQEINYQRQVAANLKSQAAQTDDTAAKAKLLDQAKDIEDQYGVDSANKAVNDAADTEERISRLKAEGAKKTTELQKELADAQAKDSTAVQKAEIDQQLESVKQQIAQQESLHTNANKKKLEQQKASLEQQQAALRTGSEDAEEQAKIAEYVKLLKDLKDADDLAGGTTNLVDALKGVQDAFKAFQDAETARLNAEKKQLQDELAAANLKYQQAKIEIDELGKEKIVGADGKFTDSSGLSKFNELAGSQLDNLDPEAEAAKVRDAFLAKASDAADKLTFANTGDKLSFENQFQQKGQALYLESLTRLTELANGDKQKQLEDQSNTGSKTLSEATKEQSDAVEQFKTSLATVGAVIESFKKTIPSQYQSLDITFSPREVQEDQKYIKTFGNLKNIDFDKISHDFANASNQLELALQGKGSPQGKDKALSDLQLISKVLTDAVTDTRRGLGLYGTSSGSGVSPDYQFTEANKGPGLPDGTASDYLVDLGQGINQLKKALQDETASTQQISNATASITFANNELSRLKSPMDNLGTVSTQLGTTDIPNLVDSLESLRQKALQIQANIANFKPANGAAPISYTVPIPGGTGTFNPNVTGGSKTTASANSSQNTNFGDINITVNTTASVDGTSMVQTIKNAMRRGTLTLTSPQGYTNVGSA